MDVKGSHSRRVSPRRALRKTINASLQMNQIFAQGEANMKNVCIFASADTP